MSNKSFFDKLSCLKANGLMKIAYRQVKVTSFHITMEMLITVYLMELTAVLTDFFLIDSNNIFQVFMVMVAPLAITIPVAAIYSAFYALYYINRLYYYYSHYFSETKEHDITKMSKKFKKEIIIAHISGIVFYIAGATLVSAWIGFKYKQHFNDIRSLILWMGIIGGGMGIIWNLTGCFRDQRMLWNKVLKDCNVKNTNLITKTNYKGYIGNIVGNVLSIIAIFVCLTIVLFNISPTLDIRSLTTDYWFLIIYLFVILGVYFKNMFELIYSNKNKGRTLYAPLDDVLEQYNKNN